MFGHTKTEITTFYKYKMLGGGGGGGVKVAPGYNVIDIKMTQ